MKIQAVKFYDYNPKTTAMADDVLEGLSQEPKWLHPKYFYDEVGSELFAEITRLPEYYPTRCELEILRTYGEAIAEVAGKNSILIEYGSGNSEKIRLLLNALRPKIYMPLDISKDHLIKSAEMLLEDFPWLEVHAACLDYSRPNELPQKETPGKRIAFFPGSSIGNFIPDDAQTFLKQVRANLNRGDGLLLGVDLRKSKEVIEAAYNDAQGITAQFNLNVLNSINERMEGKFDLDRFSHKAFFNEALSRIEMHLVSSIDQVVPVQGERIRFRKGETIHTENSYKYTLDRIEAIANLAGFKTQTVWQDSQRYFAEIYFNAI